MGNKIKAIGKILIGKKLYPPFGKDEKGEDIYYLWGEPGESFYTNKKQKRILTIMFYSIVFISLFSVLGAMFLEITNIISSISFYYINSFIFTLLSVVYIVSMCIGKRYMLFNIVPSEKRSPQKRIVFLWMGLVCAQVVILAPLLMPALEKALDILMVLSMLYVLFITRFCIKLHRTKGYYFSG